MQFAKKTVPQHSERKYKNPGFLLATNKRQIGR